jgi:hypothetical protein
VAGAEDLMLPVRRGEAVLFPSGARKTATYYRRAYGVQPSHTLRS